MQASKLYPHEYYAYHSDPPKGRVPLNAVKVRLRYTEQRKVSYMQNRSTFAAITIVDGSQAGKELTVPARQLIAFWDSYESEQRMLKREVLERNKRNRRSQLRGQILSAQVNFHLQRRGYPLTMSAFGHDTMTVPTAQVLSWLEISEEDIAQAIEHQVIEEFTEEEEAVA